MKFDVFGMNNRMVCHDKELHYAQLVAEKKNFFSPYSLSS